MRIALTVGRLERAGGVERVACALAAAYAAEGHEVSVVAEGGEPELLARYGFLKAWAPQRPAWARGPFLMATASRALRRNRFDFVHVQGTSSWLGDLITFHSVHPAWWAVARQEAQGQPALALARALHPFHHVATALERAQVRRHAGRFHACSPATAAEACWHHGIAPERIVGWPWGLELEAFGPDPTAGAAWREGLGIGPDAVVLLLVANELRRKGLGPLLEAVAALGRRDLHVVAMGRDEARPFQAQAQALGLADRFHALPAGNPRPAYQGASLMVLASAYEGWGLVLPEALACGLPVLSTPVPAATALLASGRNGALLPPGAKAQELATGLEAALAPGQLAAWAQEAAPSVAHLSWPAVARRLLAWGTGASAQAAWAAGGGAEPLPPPSLVDGAGRPFPLLG